MVIGERFVWAHLGKTGGNSTTHMFDIVEGSFIHADGIETPLKHDPFSLRIARMEKGEVESIDLSTRKRILNIRRLPAWLLSHGLHKSSIDGLDFDSTELAQGLVKFKADPKHPRSADAVLTDYAEQDKIDFWIRTEHMADDFISIIGSFVPISEHQADLIRSTRENVNRGYDRDLSQWFSRDDVELMYNRNPIWAAKEKQLYGNTLVDEVGA